MSISVEQYRSRIGSHDGNMKGKAASARLQGKFWNHMLMFYLSVFHLPCLKRLVSKHEQIHEVNVWFSQILCYHASLLLKLSNDVEENPAPTKIHEIVDCSETVCADFSQGDPRFGKNSGKEGVAMSPSIVNNTTYNVNIWDTSTLNTILFTAKSLYRYISRPINKGLLLLTDIPEMVSVDNIIYCLQYSESLYGGQFTPPNNNISHRTCSKSDIC